MKIMLISATDGGARDYVSLNLLLDRIDLKDGENIISLRDEVYGPAHGTTVKDKVGTFTLGRAKARLTTTIDNGGRLKLAIAIESADITDFVDLYDAIYARIGFRHEQLPTPKRSLGEPSFVRGIRNDLRSLASFARNRVRRLKESLMRRRGKTA